MTARINWETKAKAFHLYCVGLTQQRTADEIGVSIRTIQKWISKYNWSEGRKELEQIALQNVAKGVKEIQLSLIKSIYGLYAEKNQNPEKREKLIDDLKISDVLNTMKYEMSLENWNTENTAVGNSTDELIKELEALEAEGLESHKKQEADLKKNAELSKN